ncbi:MAG: UDP-N-acetylglucosamine 2-epimerase [Phycisphaerales bacterium]|jgi:UDP-hydrolysing UDP-N-acetyl-D-glucosamine 2-epimerase
MPDTASHPLRVAVVTGSRAEYGLLRPVMRAIAARPELSLLVVTAGSHLVLPGETFRDVKADFPIAGIVPMQVAGRTGRDEDVQSVGRGVGRFGRVFGEITPDLVVVLGDRIEAFAAATAASLGGLPLAHIHGGDRAEGIADEAMRHAITKLAHIHFPATRESADRLIRMGEDAARVHMVGSPALDELASMPAASDETWAELGKPEVVFLMHPSRGDAAAERSLAEALLARLSSKRVLAMHPNLDSGREGIIEAITQEQARRPEGFVARGHLTRALFVGVLKRLCAERGVLVGNSSAALIEAAALGLAAVDIGPRQAGRERFGNVISIAGALELGEALEKATPIPPGSVEHGYGDGHAGEKIAAFLAKVDAKAQGFSRKRCAY